ncbi:mycofactocin precursor MftA [Nocardia miyunensis]|nr:mycofactocin precursor MftA [Nocardia miyunensis]
MSEQNRIEYGTTAHQAQELDPAADSLVEDVSIDGMCGVY